MNRYRSINELVERIAQTFSWLPPFLARVAVGWVFVATGWGKLGSLEQVVGFFESLGIPYPELQAPFVATTELVCGVLILLGLATRFAAVPLIGTMVVAIATAQWPQISSFAGLLGLVETLYIVMFVWLAVAGPGPLSLDALVERALRVRESEALRRQVAATRAAVGARS